MPSFLCSCFRRSRKQSEVKKNSLSNVDGNSSKCNDFPLSDFVFGKKCPETAKVESESTGKSVDNAGNKVNSECKMPPSGFSEFALYTSKVIQVKLEKENNSFGFNLKEQCFSGKPKFRALVFSNIKAGGPADRSGVIRAGDRLLAIDGIKLSSSNVQDAVQLLKHINQVVVLTVEYDIALVETVKNATGPLLVEIEKPPGSVLGVTFSSLLVPEYALLIASIRQASIAERCGVMHVGDRVLAINDIKTDLMTSSDAMQLVRSSVGDVIKFEILSMNRKLQRFNHQVKTTDNVSYTHSKHLHFVKKNPTNYMDSPILLSSSYKASWRKFRNEDAVAYAEKTEVILYPDENGYGLKIQDSSSLSEMLSLPPIISEIEPGSSAERCGVLQVGDRILSVNNESTEGLLVETITRIIASSNLKLTLVVEFDIAESVVPSSGIFTVKLLKKTADLGIFLTAPNNDEEGQPLVIADVKRGSIAHRSGTIQAGDKLLAINSHRTENCAVADANEILNTCNDIVELRIRKDETFSEDPDTSCTVVYTVELVRHGGPLGITIAGTKEPFDPIYISGLTENGLAERTGALHIGDRILAINGQSLRGKSLNEAICILQSCGDAVTLKISRCPVTKDDKDGRMKSATRESQANINCTPQPSSIDSAVHSWDDCNTQTEFDNNQINEELIYHSTPVSRVSLSCPGTLHVRKRKKSQKNNLKRQTLPCPANWSESQPCLLDIENDLDNVFKSLQEKSSPCELDEDNNLEGIIQKYRPVDDMQETSFSAEMRVDNLNELYNQFESLCVGVSSKDDKIEQTKPKYTKIYNSSEEHVNCFNSSSSSLSARVPVEIKKVTLFKDPVYEDFGFSISDGRYEDGVYINSIRPRGPADLSGLVKPLDRILQVNNVRAFNAGLIVPLIASSGERLELVICRPIYEEEYPADRNCEFLEDTEGDRKKYLHVTNSTHCSILEKEAFTKTL